MTGMAAISKVFARVGFEGTDCRARRDDLNCACENVFRAHQEFSMVADIPRFSRTGYGFAEGAKGDSSFAFAPT